MDRRHLILNRVFTRLQTVDGIKTFWRNRDGVPDELLPAIIMLDSDEEARQETENRGRPMTTTNLVTIKPEIYITIPSQKPQNLTVHNILNDFRIKILKAIFNDNQGTDSLQSLIGANGEIFYAGCATDLARNRPMNGEMGLMLHIKYVFRPGEF